jgi:hypothetical protein
MTAYRSLSYKFWLRTVVRSPESAVGFRNVSILPII